MGNFLNRFAASVRRRGDELRAGLNRKLGQHPHVGDIRGRGLLIGIEIVKDRGTKDPFGTERKLPARIKAAAMEGGLICYPGGGTADGVRGDHVLLAPPFIVGEGEVAEIVARLGAAIDAALHGLVP